MNKKFLFLPFIAVIVLGLIFLSTQIPSAKMSPNGIPVGIVSVDQGEMGSTFVDNIYTQLEASGMTTLAFTTYESQEAFQTALDEQDIYGGIVIPENFSANFASLQTAAPEQPTLQFFLNQGKNSNVSSILSSAFEQMGKQLNTAMSTQILQGLAQANVPIQASQVAILANPILTETITVHGVGALNAAPTAFFQPLWFASILGAVLLYLSSKKAVFASRSEKYKWNGIQAIVGIVYAFFSAYFITWSTTWLLGFEYSNFNTIALFGSLAVLAFLFLIYACLQWFKLPAIAIFVLIMFFGLPLIQMAPEMLPEFYQNYVLPWLPMKFLINGLKDILFYNYDIFNHNGVVLLWIAVVSLVVALIKQIIEKPKREA